jgi:GTPase SAR1 family protein
VKIIYLIGAPGSGKTTLTEAFTHDWRDSANHEDPIKFRTHHTPHGDALSLGWLRPAFGGTDTLGNTAILAIEPWLPQIAKEYSIIYGEGDRLANSRFFDLCKGIGEFHLFYLNTEPELCAQRRYERSLKTGKTQNPSWVKGRETKHRNLAKTYKAFEIPSGLTPQAGADLMRNVIFPHG